MTALGFSLSLLLAYYVFFVLRVALGLRRLEGQDRVDETPSVAVVIAARNEEHSIAACVQSVLSQEYQGTLEVIVVNDASTDSTSEVVTRLSREDSRVQLVTLSPRAESGIGGKPEAIRAGVKRASSEIILTTDADCSHRPTWVRTMMSYMSPAAALVAGPVLIGPGSGWFAGVERLDFLGLVTSGAGLIGANRPMICNGANLAYRREVYLRALSDVQHSSNDDGTLMSRIVTRGLGSVRFALDAGAVVTTPGQQTIRAFFRQRRRWAAVRGRFLDPTIYLELALLFSFFVVLLATTLTSFWVTDLATVVIAAWCIKCSIDVFPLVEAMRLWNVERRWGQVAMAEIFHPFSIVIATVLSLVAPFRWKDRTLVR